MTLSGEACRLLDSRRIGHLATADRSGRPHVVPLCYVRDGDQLYFVIDEKPKAAGKTLKRMRNIAENPEVALVVDRYDEDWTRLEYVLVRGRADIVAEREEYDRVLSLLRARYPQYEAMRLESAKNPLVRITPATVHHWRARATERP
jgi:PPOX class probable F420-dependent enzyme